jgi:D-xylose transport system ATP-binding protein
MQSLPAGIEAVSPVDTAPLLAVEGVTKRFPGVLAIDKANVEVASGEIVALVGANGAGKSTLVQIIAGIHAHGSYEGRLALNGQNFRPSNIAEAEAAGIVMIPQEVNVALDLSVGQNIFLNREPTRFGIIDWTRMFVDARAALQLFGVDLDVTKPMDNLDPASRQLVVVVRALTKNARLLILDEPTSLLTESETRRLLGYMRQIRSHGISCIFVSHRLAEVFAIADRIVVMRDGKIQRSYVPTQTTPAEVVRDMVGTVSLAVEAGGAAPDGQVALEVRDLCVYDRIQTDRPRVSGVSFELRHGEVLGLFGLVGAGCPEIAMAIFGAGKGRRTGTIYVDGKRREIDGPIAAIACGLGLITGDRRDSLALDLSIADNVVLASLDSVCKHGVLDITAKYLETKSYMDRLRIQAQSPDSPVRTLSGGNQQKVLVARWLKANVRILIMDQPTRGVDVAARAEIYRLVRDLANRGYAILLISSESEELLMLCDRFLVIRNGLVIGDLGRESVTEEGLIHMAAGSS